MKETPTAPPLYPVSEDGQNYRLQKISELEQQLIKERDVRASLFKKYKRAIAIVDSIDVALITASLGLSVTGFVVVPVMLPFEITAGVFGLFGIAGRLISRKLQRKAKKHDEIRMVAVTMLNSMKVLISKSLQDGSVFEQEFKSIFDNVEMYHKMKHDIQVKQVKITDKERNELIMQGKAEVMKWIKK